MASGGRGRRPRDGLAHRRTPSHRQPRGIQRPPLPRRRQRPLPHARPQHGGTRRARPAHALDGWAVPAWSRRDLGPPPAQRVRQRVAHLPGPPRWRQPLPRPRRARNRLLRGDAGAHGRPRRCLLREGVRRHVPRPPANAPCRARHRGPAVDDRRHGLARGGVRGPWRRAGLRNAPARRANGRAAPRPRGERRRNGPGPASAVGGTNAVGSGRHGHCDDSGGRTPHRAHRDGVGLAPRIAACRAARRADVDVRNEPHGTVRLHGHRVCQAAPARLRDALPPPPRGDPGDRRNAVRRPTHPLYRRGHGPRGDADLPPRRAGYLGALAGHSRPQHRPHPRVHRIRAGSPLRSATAVRGGPKMTGERPLTLVLLEMTLLVLLGPLVTGTIQKLKALLQCRQGAGILQPYHDIIKLLRKGTVQADTTSGFFRSIPVLVLAATVAAGALVPVVRAGPPAFPLGDALMLLGLLALARFLTAVGAFAAGGALGGRGASREMTIAPLVEPVLMMVVFSTAVAAGTTELGALAAHRGASWIFAWRAADFLGFAAMLVLLPAETGRIPVDNPDTHLELTMLHEGMLLEHSGPGLGCMMLASHTRQIVTLGLVSALFFPVGLAAGAGAFAAKILVLATWLALVESSYAKLRFFRVPQYLGIGFVCALTALALRIL